MWPAAAWRSEATRNKYCSKFNDSTSNNWLTSKILYLNVPLCTTTRTQPGTPLCIYAMTPFLWARSTLSPVGGVYFREDDKFSRIHIIHSAWHLYTTATLRPFALMCVKLLLATVSLSDLRCLWSTHGCPCSRVNEAISLKIIVIKACQHLSRKQRSAPTQFRRNVINLKVTLSQITIKCVNQIGRKRLRRVFSGDYSQMMRGN